MIDCGADWLGRLGAVSPDAIVVTHAHPDHASGLSDGAPCPVYATVETWHSLRRMPISLRQVVLPKTPFTIGTLKIEAFPVVHSPTAPAVGYRMRFGNASLFYVPDVLEIPDSLAILGGIDLFIGDGARMDHPIRRGEGDRASGHASIHQQLAWCVAAKVNHAIFTHCGTPIIRAESRSIEEALGALARPLGITASFACDGDEICLSAEAPPSPSPKRSK